MGKQAAVCRTSFEKPAYAQDSRGEMRVSQADPAHGSSMWQSRGQLRSVEGSRWSQNPWGTPGRVAGRQDAELPRSPLPSP